MNLTNSHLALEQDETISKHGKHDHRQTDDQKKEIFTENENDSAKEQSSHVWGETGVWF